MEPNIFQAAFYSYPHGNLHDGLLLFGMPKTKGVAYLVYENVEEAGPVLGPVQRPHLEVVKVNVPVECPLRLIVGIECVRENIRAVQS